MLLILKSIRQIDAKCISSIAGDAGPGVAKTKKTVNEKYPWILHVCDTCHQLNQASSDIVTVAGNVDVCLASCLCLCAFIALFRHLEKQKKYYLSFTETLTLHTSSRNHLTITKLAGHWRHSPRPDL